jgi:chorismate mutase
MSSDYEAANVLIAVATRNTLDEVVRAAYLKAANNLRSDYESQRARDALRRG